MPALTPVALDYTWRHSIAKANKALDQANGFVEKRQPVQGEKVRLQGLINRWDLNGLEGELLSMRKDKHGRMTVRLSDSGRSYWFDPKRIEPLQAPKKTIASSLSLPSLTPGAASECQSNVSAGTGLTEFCFAPGVVAQVNLEARKGSGGGRGFRRQTGGAFFPA
eukprot:TRINITY_DN32220_c0_g1_i1.p1 TRINITY_DN32220_c0_g1~~TRINITY_DN32220_c0_g1_i1.p1  ORF type:complete len:165 (-),score=35.47 TRINITY_DN32220_c0_g1_i1:95-589(-)